MSFRHHEILEFWGWFATIADELGNDLSNEALHDELDARLGGLGDLAWELGPGSRAENVLAISPDGNRSLMPLTQRIVAMAPELPHWQFHPARPARPESLEFSFATRSGAEIAVDARSWRYILYRFQDNVFDIVLEQGNLADATDDDRYTAAVVMLDALLGEGNRLLRIRDMEPVVALNADDTKKASLISQLPAHLKFVGDQTKKPQ